MSRPPLEVADLIRVAGQKFIEASRRWITGQHLKVLAAIERCRTAALGGHRDRCVRCGYRAHSFNSCRNRHCPKCQALARDRWLRARRRELLPTPYVHVVFTLPRRLAPLALQNKKVIYDLLFRTCAETLLEIARDPRHLGAEIGFFSVLHSWNQKLEHHPHVHCVVPAGGLSPDHQRWIHPRYRFFLPVKVLGRVFRGKFVAALRQAFDDGQLGFYGDLKLLAEAKAFASFLRPLFRQDWVVYCKPPFGGPEHVLRYLGRYTHRVAISNHRLVSLRGQPSHLPLERLRARQPATPDDPGGRGVLAPLPAPRASPGLRAHPPLWLSGPPTARRSLATLLPVPGTTGRFTTRTRTTTRGGRRLLDPPAFHFHVVLPPVRRPHDHPGATHRGGNAPAFSTAHSPEALMKYVISIRSHRVRPPRARSRVPGHMRSIHPSSPDPFTLSPKDHRVDG